MTYEEIAQAREELAQKLADGTLKYHGNEYSCESSRLDQLTAACRARADQKANDGHAASVAASVAANNAIAENQAKVKFIVDQASLLVKHGDATLVVMRELVDAVRELSPIGVARKLWRTVKP